jgi:hypothetical protein
LGSDASTESLGDLLLEPCVAKCPAAIGRSAQSVDEIDIGRGAEERPIFLLSLGWRAAAATGRPGGHSSELWVQALLSRKQFESPAPAGPFFDRLGRIATGTSK